MKNSKKFWIWTEYCLDFGYGQNIVQCLDRILFSKLNSALISGQHWRVLEYRPMCKKTKLQLLKFRQLNIAWNFLPKFLFCIAEENLSDETNNCNHDYSCSYQWNLSFSYRNDHLFSLKICKVSVKTAQERNNFSSKVNKDSKIL